MRAKGVLLRCRMPGSAGTGECRIASEIRPRHKRTTNHKAMFTLKIRNVDPKFQGQTSFYYNGILRFQSMIIPKNTVRYTISPEKFSDLRKSRRIDCEPLKAVKFVGHLKVTVI
jgi:hypothetical protein